jgi:uncharacterized membrane protein YjgN (DUF898 family)
MAAGEDLLEPITAMPLGREAAEGREFGIRFTGSGSEYFRIWIVNLLLMLVTLGLYYPWAKVRKQRYFYGNTLVGNHAFDFHGDPKRMLRGYLLVALLAALYGASGHFSPLAAVVAAGLVAAVWPALFRASQQFRMANTSWRGLRFRFTGSLGAAYAAVLPMLLPVLVLAVDAPSEADGAAPSGPGVLYLIAMFVLAVLGPLCWWLLKRYQHNHYALGERRTTLSVGVGSFYGVSFQVGGIALIIGLLGTAVVAGFAGLVAQSVPRGEAGGAAVLWVTAGVIAMYMVFFCVLHPYSTARMQNLVWSNTAAAPVLRLDSALRFGPLARLTLKNMLLTVLTLGLYWPFAAVATARLRLESVTVHLPEGAARLAAGARHAHHDAAGEAAGDLFGIDLGL